MEQINPAKFGVVIGIDPSSPYGQLLEILGDRIELSNGQFLLNFWCSQVDATNPIYLEIVAHKQATDAGSRFRIPHQQVCLIADPEIVKRAIGFVAQ